MRRMSRRVARSLPPMRRSVRKDGLSCSGICLKRRRTQPLRRVHPTGSTVPERTLQISTTLLFLVGIPSIVGPIGYVDCVPMYPMPHRATGRIFCLLSGSASVLPTSQRAPYVFLRHRWRLSPLSCRMGRLFSAPCRRWRPRLASVIAKVRAAPLSSSCVFRFRKGPAGAGI